MSKTKLKTREELIGLGAMAQELSVTRSRVSQLLHSHNIEVYPVRLKHTNTVPSIACTRKDFEALRDAEQRKAAAARRGRAGRPVRRMGQTGAVDHAGRIEAVERGLQQLRLELPNIVGDAVSTVLLELQQPQVEEDELPQNGHWPSAPRVALGE